MHFHFIFPNRKIVCLYLPFSLDTWLLCMVIIFIKVILNLCVPGHISLLERLGCFEDASWSCLWSFCVQLKIKSASDGFFIFGLHMQSDSEYPMRRRSPLASAATFIHKLCLSEVDLIERMAWLCKGTRAIHKWDAWSSGFWFTGTQSSLFLSLCVCVCVSVRERVSERKTECVAV